jgi:phage/plasmid-associated DNA primase
MTDPEAAQRDGNRNSLVSKFCTQAIYEGIQPELILGALLAPHLPISNHMYYHATGKPRSEGEVIAIARKKIKDAFKWVRAHPRSNHTKHETPTAQKDAVHGRAVGEILQQHQIKNLGGKDFAQFVGNHWATLTEQEQIRLFRSEGARWSYNVGNTEKAFIPTNRSDQEMLTELLNQTDELADQNPNFIPFKNGQLNTRNGELLPHAPKYTNRNVLDVSYDPADDKPQEFLTWLWHLTTSEMIKNADGSLRRWDMGRDPTRAMRRNMEIIGYILSGRSDLQILISWYATGGNGKGLLIELLENLLASGVVEISAHDLDPAKERFGLTDLIDARVVTLPELDNALSPGAFETVKKITANDKMKIKLHGKQGVQIRPNVVVLMTPNTRPRLSGTVQAIERRFEAFAYNGAFRTEKDPRKVSALDPFVVPQDPNYIDKLLVERGAIVNACITAFLARPGKFFTTTRRTRKPTRSCTATTRRSNSRPIAYRMKLTATSARMRFTTSIANGIRMSIPSARSTQRRHSRKL